MQVFRVAVLKAAVQMVLVHNDPSGEVKPSKEDINITDRLIQVGNILGIKVIDHLIIREKTYNSFNDTELLSKIEESTRYMPTYKQQAELKKEAAEIAVQKEKMKFAQYLKDKDFTIAEIIEATGITEAEAKRLKTLKPKSTKK